MKSVFPGGTWKEIQNLDGKLGQKTGKEIAATNESD